MRTRAALVVTVLLLPMVADAQRLRLPGTNRRPGGPTELPPPAPAVARDMAYRRLPVSAESYQIVSYFDSPGLAGGIPATSYTSGGVGTRLDYRIARNISATLDLTASIFGGPAITQTAELGARIRPDRSERRVYPFVDVRAGYIHSQQTGSRPLDFAPGSGAQTVGFAGRYSHGPGVLAGTGMEVALTRTLSFTTMASAMRSRLKSQDFASNVPVVAGSYPMMMYRFSAGLRYNPVRYFTVPGTDVRGAR